jgi:undecaprenyl-diphosphatase
LLWQWHYWDAALSHLMAANSNRRQRGIATVGAHLGDSWLWAVVTALLWRWWQLQRGDRTRLLWGWTTSLATGTLLALAIKRWIRRPRPQETFLLHGPGADRYSFPSGHAVRWGVVMMWSSRFLPHGALLAWPPALWTGWSRVHLGIHYVGDVAAGFAAGALVGWLARYLFGEKQKQ